MGTSIENLVNSGELSIETILSEAKEFEENYWVHPSGLIVSTKKEKPTILNHRKAGGKRKYSRVTLSINGKNKYTYVHILVAKTFIENPLNKSQVNHIDGNTDNNSVSNLEWVTPKENTQHAFRIGLSPKGSECSWAKTTDEVVTECYKLYIKGYSIKCLKKMLGLTQSQVWHIVTGKTWRHITEPLERATTIPNGSTQ